MPKISRIEALKAMEEVQSEREDTIHDGVAWLTPSIIWQPFRDQNSGLSTRDA